MDNRLGDTIGNHRATNARASIIAAWLLLAALTLAALACGVVCVSGCQIHAHFWGTYDADRYDVPTTQGAGAKTPEITLEIPE
mgnify:CR=1 FL=1